MSDADPNRLTPEERYRRDAQFHTLVDALEAMIHRCDMTPTEIREAAMLAAIHYEYQRTPPPILLSRPEWEQFQKVSR